MTNDYVDLVGDIMYPKCSFENFPEEQKVFTAFVLFFPLLSIELPQLPYDKFSTLGYLLSPLRDPTVIGMSLQPASSSLVALHPFS
jgi:hypothetical protein